MAGICRGVVGGVVVVGGGGGGGGGGGMNKISAQHRLYFICIFYMFSTPFCIACYCRLYEKGR